MPLFTFKRFEFCAVVEHLRFGRQNLREKTSPQKILPIGARSFLRLHHSTPNKMPLGCGGFGRQILHEKTSSPKNLPPRFHLRCCFAVRLCFASLRMTRWGRLGRRYMFALRTRKERSDGLASLPSVYSPLAIDMPCGRER